MADAYSPPVRDQLFLLEAVLNAGRLFAFPAYRHADMDTVRAVLEQGTRFAAEVLAPLNRTGDEAGSRIEGGRVVTPPGFREAYAQYAAGGWPGLDQPLDCGGQALPLVVQAAFGEMVDGACLAFGMLPINQRACARLLAQHADAGLRARVVPKLASGEWGATICISEPQAGSDVARITTKAVPRGDGTYAVSGHKIFISYGDHDLTGQIVHMVLARTPGAPPGTRGLSLFLVPKQQIEPDGSLGARNGVEVSRVEHKMGLKASPTCALGMTEARGLRIGDEHAGLKTLFAMMNTMRLAVAVQGVGVAGRALGAASRYAAERPQGGGPERPPLPIIEHADVRRMLFAMRARTEGLRALVLETALALDLAAASPDAGERAAALDLAEWLLPVCKACGAEVGFEVANLAIQVFGGHGYISDAGVEQLARDGRVLAIYEGTNGIQALDLATRKLVQDGGRRYQRFVQRVRADLERLGGAAQLDALRDALQDALARLEAVTLEMRRRIGPAPRDVEAGATPYLQLVGLVACGWMWLRMAAAADDASEFARLKRATARFCAEQMLPQAALFERQALAGSAAIDSVESGPLGSL
jgi:alkylation response protein AidB-like acyl-CoA dehydrogenase